MTYGLRAHEVAKLTLEDIDWKRERFQVRSARLAMRRSYPLAGVVAEALIDYLKQVDLRPRIAICFSAS